MKTVFGSEVFALLYELMFFAIPTLVLIFFGISLYRYRTAVTENKKSPDTFAPEEIKRRKVFLILSAVMMAVLAVVVAGFVVLLFMAIAFM